MYRDDCDYRGIRVALSTTMDCFFGTYNLHADKADGSTAVVTFNIPEIGIRFKAPFSGVSQNHCDLASLLALLEFIDRNQKYFSKHTYQIFGDCSRVINQVNGREPFPTEFSNLMDKASAYRDKYRFSLEWVPLGENAAFDTLFD